MNLVFRAFFAPMQMALVSSAGVPTKAVYIFLRTLRKIMKDYDPEHAAVGAVDDTAGRQRRPLLAERITVVRRDAVVRWHTGDGAGARQQRADHAIERMPYFT